MALKLNNHNLNCSEPNVIVPNYSRSALTPGCLHVGVGNFHRAHMAVYFDKLFELGLAMDWGIIGGGYRRSSVEKRDKLKEQDFLTTVVEVDSESCSARIVKSMIDYVSVDPVAVYTALLDPDIRIVSLTLTEGGYYVDGATGEFNVGHPEVQWDRRNPDAPKTIFGLLARALAARRARGTIPFTILSCDNLQSNGSVTRSRVVELARMHDPDLAIWIEDHVSFPNSMVDCITASTAEREIELVAERFGILDNAPVVCEPFRQWVIEDQFPAGRPPLENVGVEFVTDVSGYELMKLRIVNAGHAALCYPSALLGHHFVHQAMSDTDIRAWLRKFILCEMIPTLDSLPEVNYEAYLDEVIKRFSNSEIYDTVSRLSADGSDCQQRYIFPALTEALKVGKSVDGMALQVALWCRYCMGLNEEGRHLAIQDKLVSDLQHDAGRSLSQPEVFLGNREIFGYLGNNERFCQDFSKWHQLIHREGVRRAINDYIAS